MKLETIFAALLQEIADRYRGFEVVRVRKGVELKVRITHRGIFDNDIDLLAIGVDNFPRPFATIHIHGSEIELSTKILQSVSLPRDSWKSHMFEPANPAFPQNLYDAIENHAVFIEFLRAKLTQKTWQRK
jgi:hypothetical protein